MSPLTATDGRFARPRKLQLEANATYGDQYVAGRRSRDYWLKAHLEMENVTFTGGNGTVAAMSKGTATLKNVLFEDSKSQLTAGIWLETIKGILCM